MTKQQQVTMQYLRLSQRFFRHDNITGFVATDILKDHGTFTMSGAANPLTKCEIQEDMNVTMPEDLHVKW